MLVQELYRRLSLGHFSNLAIGMDGAGDLTELGKKQAILHLNDALRALSARFPLKEETVLLVQRAGRSTYKLTPEFAWSSQQDHKVEPQTYYLLDSKDKKFPGRVIRVLRVYWDGHHEMVLNETDNPASLHSTGDTLIIPFPVENRVLAVTYQAQLDEVPEGRPDYEIPVPMVLETAALLYTAGRIYQNMQSPENIARGQSLMQQFEAECLIVATEDLLGSSRISVLPKFGQRGFV